MDPLSFFEEENLSKALGAVKLMERVSTATKEYNVKRWTLYKYNQSGEIHRKRVNCGPMLHTHTEEVLLKLLLCHAQKGVPLTQHHLMEAIHFMIHFLSSGHRVDLRISDVEK